MNDYATLTDLDNYATVSSLSDYFPLSNIKQYYTASIYAQSGTWTQVGNIESLLNISTYGNDILLIITVTNYSDRSMKPTGIHLQKAAGGVGNYQTTNIIGHIENTNSSYSYNELTLTCRASSYDDNELFVMATNNGYIQVRIFAIILDD